MEDTAIRQATEALVKALCQGEAYQAYHTLRDTVMGDETNRVLLKEYQRAQAALQMAAVAGQEAEPEAMERFSKLSALLSMNGEASDYLLAQLRLQKLAGEVFQRITDGLGLDFGLPGL